MSTPSSSARGPGPSPGSQITASVVKFRCLFTYDLRRKSKRWQDGYLKYHAFNKRAMVYDEQGNYIGDHHWRSAEEVQDGDELELDKGVLIEVGERMSTTQTDLSNLFEKRRSQTSPQSRDNHPAADTQPPRSSTSISTPTYTPTPVRSSASSHPFRSLNDLLGIRKTPIGHLVSPYEERHGPPAPAPPAPEPERATKRAKISTARTTSKVLSDVVDLTGPENGPLRQRAPVRETPPQRDSRPTMPPPEKPVAVASLPSPSVPTPIQPPPTKPTANHAPLSGSTVQDNHPERPVARSQQNDKSSAVPDDARFKKPAAPRMTMQKPRNKFMYSTLQQQPSSVPSTTTTEKQRRLPVLNPTDSQLPRRASTRVEVESANTEFLPSDATQFALEDIAAPSGFENGSSRDQRPAEDMPRNLSARRSFDAPLRKSLSDPSALNKKPSLQARPTPMRGAMSAVPEEPEVLEEGPWTAEALDLFDFWPPGRPKPV
ncbi:hypothetical protein N7451_007999 [Penicillium sp. IBT 35674x]|nr:hypothetical protein N7451_007999 [Penicillium sp. IBT 35674x]